MADCNGLSILSWVHAIYIVVRYQYDETATPGNHGLLGTWGTFYTRAVMPRSRKTLITDVSYIHDSTQGIF